MRVLFVVAVALFAAAAPVNAQEPAGCPDVEWVSFTMDTPYTPEVAGVVADVWLPSLLLPCPLVGWSIGRGQITAPLDDSRSGAVAAAHAACIGLCWVPAVLSVIGIPLLLVEQMYVAPVSTLNALDRDVRCGRAAPSAASSPAASSPSSSTPSSLPLPDRAERPAAPRGGSFERERMLPSSPDVPRRDDRLPPPSSSPSDPQGPRRLPMAF